jgi:hypothetical protein
MSSEKEWNDFRTRWTDIQTGSVDKPRQSVEQAHALVAEVIKRLTNGFVEERSRLERQCSRGRRLTEDLRVALQRYRAFCDRNPPDSRNGNSDVMPDHFTTITPFISGRNVQMYGKARLVERVPPRLARLD